MKCAYIMVSAVVGTLVVHQDAHGQTVLSTGDITIIGVHHDDFSGTGGPPKAFSFVSWVDIAPGTVVSFTDNGWQNPEEVFRLGEGVISWTAGAAVAAGTVVVLPGAMGTFNLSTSGDQMFAFQGSIDGVSGAFTGSLIFGVNNNGTGVWQATASDSNTSALPAALDLSGGNLALIEVDNAQYTGPRSGYANVSAGSSAVLNLANWSFSYVNEIGPLDDTPFTFLTGDYNGDGHVDAADYVVWRKALGGQSEYAAWRANFGMTISDGNGLVGDFPARAVVPEPATLALLPIAATYFARRILRPHYHGAPHVQVWVNVADDPSVKLNAYSC